MYLITIHVPVYVKKDRKFLATDWHRSLLLLRDALGGRYGQIVVGAPYLPLEHQSSQYLECVNESEDEIQLEPSFDGRGRCRNFWLRNRQKWSNDLRRLVAKADVVHAGVDDVYRPITFLGLREGLQQGKPTVFVSDTDIVLQQAQLTAQSPMMTKLKSAAYCSIYERMTRYGVKRAALTLLKGQALITRYGKYARNVKSFQDTSYLKTEIVPESVVVERLHSLQQTRPIRMVYCGRLIGRKGVDCSIRLLAAARAKGADVEFDIIGDGPERPQLAKLVEQTEMQKYVRFLGPLPYGPALLTKLASYDALLLTPVGEDTPRVVFDAYAAGLPIVGRAIAYLQERADEDRATILLPFANTEESVQILVRVCQDRNVLVGAAKNAIRAALFHAADEWYRRRAEWTFEAVAQHKSERNCR